LFPHPHSVIYTLVDLSIEEAVSIIPLPEWSGIKEVPPINGVIPELP
jgi:hypothetical protein